MATAILWIPMEKYDLLMAKSFPMDPYGQVWLVYTEKTLLWIPMGNCFPMNPYGQVWLVYGEFCPVFPYGQAFSNESLWAGMVSLWAGMVSLWRNLSYGSLWASVFQ